MRFLTLAIVGLAVGSSTVQARLQVNGLFTDHVVLQQQLPVPVWGQAAPGKVITVRFADQVRQATADEQGRWLLRLDPLPASKQRRSLSISGDGGTIALEDVVVGEVWIGSGQSNMALALSQTEDGTAALPHATHPLIRVFQRPQGKKARESWHTCSPETLQDFSAVAYFFGKNLHENRDVPVGLIVRAVGGTTIQRWVSAAASRQNEFIAARMQEASRRKDEFARFEREKAKYDKRHKPDAVAAKWLVEMGNLAHYRGLGYGGLYQRLIRPLQPLAIRGVIWYQGEFNNRSGQAFDYRQWQSTLIDSWRRDWGQGDFPFLFVQMQVLGNATTTLLRESQATTLDRCPNTAMAVICDQSVGLHPRHKQIAGDRLAAAARSLIDGDTKSVGGPLLREANRAGDRFVLHFDHVGRGLSVKGPALKGFFVCGEDRCFEMARAELTGPDQITVWSDRIAKPAAVRYAWLNDPRGYMTVFDSAGLPASPFRTDDWPGAASLHELIPQPPRRKPRKPQSMSNNTNTEGNPLECPPPS